MQTGETSAMVFNSLLQRHWLTLHVIWVLTGGRS